MPLSVIAAARFARAANGRALFGRSLQAAAAIGFGGAAVLLLVRALGGHLAPSWWWFAALGPAVPWVYWRFRRERLSLPAAAAHLDQRLALDGLLLTAMAHAEAELATGFAARLQDRLAAARSVAPSLQWRRVLAAPAIATALLILVLQLPPPVHTTAPPPGPAVQLAVQHMAEQLQELQRGHVPDETSAELDQRIAELKAQMADGKSPEWSELDRLAAELQRQELLQQLRTEAALAAAAQAAAAAAVDVQTAAAHAAAAMAAAGLLDDLPIELQQLLAQAADGLGGFDAAKLPADPAALQRLIEAMGLATAGGVQGEGDGSLPGKGGIDRGPGVAALQFDNDSQGGAPQVLPLPPGQAAPADWVPIGTRPSEPTVDPVRAAGEGRVGDTGSADAAWQLRVAPRHRAVLQRYFADRNSASKGNR